MKSISLTANDESGTKLFSYEVPSVPKMNVQTLLEHAFCQHQHDASNKPDPFQYLLKYYGYSTNPAFPGYLGYELESINDISDPDHYWELMVKGNVSPTGIDTTYLEPGDSVTFNYVKVAAKRGMQNKRAQAITERRSMA